jgi:type IV pilus assembly protein PilZ
MANRDTSRSGINKPGLLTLTIKDKSALYMAYMPFVRNGGLFIPTNSNYRLGDEVFMLLNLMGEDEKLPVAGRVIWVTPKGAQGKRTAGIGVQFSGAGPRPDAEEDRELPGRCAHGRQADPHHVRARPWPRASGHVPSTTCPPLST